jgi:hypothetical protein
MKRVVLTYHFGEHDNLLEPICENLDWDFICITNNLKLVKEKETTRWKFAYIPDSSTTIYKGNKRKSSAIKIYPYDVFMALSEYDYILNLDGNCIVKSDTQLTELCNELFEEDKDIAMTKLGAPDGGIGNVSAEAEQIIKCNRDSKENVDTTLNNILHHPSFNGEHQKMGISNIILRKNTQKVKEFFYTWREFYLMYPSIRDQLTFPLAVSHFNKKNASGIKLNFFSQSQHRQFNFLDHNHKYD